MLTLEEIKNLPAGKELDAAIAEHVLGHIWLHNKRYGVLRPSDEADLIVEDGHSNYGKHPEGHWIGPDDKYSTDLAAAWEVIEAVRKLGWYSQHTDLTLDSGTDWWAWHFLNHAPPGNEQVSAYAATAPLAICRAALLVLLAPTPPASYTIEKTTPETSI
jgi:hypothetical protein